jgi:hypothetical protein
MIFFGEAVPTSPDHACLMTFSAFERGWAAAGESDLAGSGRGRVVIMLALGAALECDRPSLFQEA